MKSREAFEIAGLIALAFVAVVVVCAIFFAYFAVIGAIFGALLGGIAGAAVWVFNLLAGVKW